MAKKPLSGQSLIEFAAKERTQSLVRRLLAYAKPYIPKIIFGSICMIVVAAMTAASAKLMKPIINDIFVNQDHSMLWPITGLIFLVFFTKGLFGYGESVLMAFVGHRVIADVQKDFFQALMKADLSFYQVRQTGDLVSRFVNDVSKLNTAITGTLSSMVKDLLTLIFFILIMFDEDWRLASVVFVILPIAILPVVIIGRKMRKTSTKVQEHTADLTSLLTQSFQGIRMIKSYCLEALETVKMNQVIEDVFNRTIKGVKTKSVSHPVMEFLGGVAIAVVILYGGSQVIEGTHSPGAFFTFITALIMSYEPLKRLANLNANFQEQLAAAHRVFTLMDVKNTILESPDAKDVTLHKGEIQLDTIHFAYETDKDLPVLKNISLTIKAGEKAALVGPSGGGKSTLMNLIPRFFDPLEGRVLIDGIDIKSITLASLRHQIALVSQDVVLFDDTIKNNIKFGQQDASDDDVIAAAQSAAAHEFIMSLPQGYDTKIGEQGLRLSGGQRQRLSIARAFLKNAPILLMDEPTSALDTESEQLIQKALTNLMKGRTTLTIAHRLSTIRSSDTIYVLEEGGVTDQGTHEQLMETSKRYRDLCQAQLHSNSVSRSQIDHEKA